VAAANRKTVVVLQTGGPVTMPWLDQARAVLEAWYPGARGGQAIAAILFGDVNPSGRLPLTFPASEADTPNPSLPGATQEKGRFDAQYPEGADAGYRWYARTGRTPLFPFGFGLSYTSFAYANLALDTHETFSIAFDLSNTGQRAGAEVAQVYLTSAGGEAMLRLIGWAKVALDPGETRRVTVTADPRLLSRYDIATGGWAALKGPYEIAVGASAMDLRLRI
jgi:beta-glucosidase